LPFRIKVSSKCNQNDILTKSSSKCNQNLLKCNQDERGHDEREGPQLIDQARGLQY